jgi:arabinofuranan 3-O-arabinosyltransferase
MSDKGMSSRRFFSKVAQGSGIVFFLLAAFSFVVVLPRERGFYLGDNRFMDSWNPHRLLGSLFSVWDPRVDVGGPQQHYQPITDTILVVLRGIGLEPWSAQRVWFALILILGSFGMALLVRMLIPHSQWEAGIAGVWFICAPFTSGFFFPTSLLLNVALAPWFVLAVWKGTTTQSSWRWASVVALGVLISGTRNPPGLVMALIPAGVAAIALVVGGQIKMRRLAEWTTRAALLTGVVVVPAVMRSVMSAATLARNLGSTESVDAVSLSSSWSESIRGLGFWLHYWNPRGSIVLPYLTAYFTNPWVVIATFVPPAFALAVVAFGRHRSRFAAGAMLTTAVAIMVGAFPVGNESPYGIFLRWLYDQIPATFAFRNAYKAGAGLVVGIGLLLALGINDLRTRTGTVTLRTWPKRALAVTVAAMVLVATGWPLLTGNIFQYGQRIQGDVPTYWHNAFTWLDAQPGKGRVLVLPGSRSEDYRWGSAGNGDLFPSLLNRPAIFSRPLTGSPAEAANLTRALDRAVSNGRYEPGTIAPIARRLGIQFIVIRNDLNWQQTGVIRPSGLDALRKDPSIIALKNFGDPGENVTRPGDSDPISQDELTMPPVEVFSVPNVDDVVRAISPSPAVLLSGDGDAWTSLARSGALDNLGPIRATASLNNTEIKGELANGASVVLSDTNRRRPLAWGKENNTLTADDTDNVDDLYGSPGSQTVAVNGDALRVEYLGPNSLFDLGAARRPAAAFDGDPTTAWLTGFNSYPGQQRIRIELTKPTLIEQIHLRVAEVAGGRTINRVAVLLPNREPLEFDVSAGLDNLIRIPALVTESISVVPLQVIEPGGGPFGFSEISIPGLDLRERLKMPDDITIAAESDPQIAELLKTSPFSVEMQRLIGDQRDPENALARRFRAPVSRTMDVSGGIQLGTSSSAYGIAQVFRSSTSAFAKTLNGDISPLESLAAIDGDLKTSWAAPNNQSSLTLHFNNGNIKRATIAFSRDKTSEIPRVLRVTRADQEIEINAERRCQSDITYPFSRVGVTVDVGDRICTISLEWPSEKTSSDEVQFSFGTSPTKTPTKQTEIHVLEAWVGDQMNVLTNLDNECRNDLVYIDGHPIGVQTSGSVKQLLAGQSIALSSCTPVEIAAGWREVTTAPGLPLNWLRFKANDGNAVATTSAIHLKVLSRSADEYRISIDAPIGTRLILGQAYSDSWKLNSSAGELHTQSLDTQSGWTLATGGPQEVHVIHSARNSYRFATAMSLAGLAVLLLLIVIDPWQRIEKLSSKRSRSEKVIFRGVTAAAAVMVFAILVGGWPTLIVATVALTAMIGNWVRPRVLGAASVALICLAAIATIPPVASTLQPIWPLWPSERWLAHELARLAVVLMMSASTGMAISKTTIDETENPSSLESEDSQTEANGSQRVQLN